MSVKPVKFFFFFFFFYVNNTHFRAKHELTSSQTVAGTDNIADYSYVEIQYNILTT